MQILVLVLAMLTVTRLSMLFVDDKLLLRFRQWVVRKYGEDSLASYMVFCNWCLSVWIAVPVMPAAILVTWGITKLSVVVSILSIPVASLVAGLLSKIRDGSS